MRKVAAIVVTLLASQARAQLPNRPRGIHFPRGFSSVTRACGSPSKSCLYQRDDGTLHFSNVGAGISDFAIGSGGGGANATIGAWTLGLLSQTSTEVNVLKFDPAEANNTDWYEWFSKTANINPRTNHVRMVGWNCGSGGGTVIATDGAMCNSKEQHFDVDGGSDSVMEEHDFYAPPITASDTATNRYKSALCSKSTGKCGLYLFADRITLGQGHNNQDQAALLIEPTKTSLTSPGQNAQPGAHRGYRQLLLDDGDGTVRLFNGDGGNTDRGGMVIDSSGNTTVYSNTGVGRLSFSGNVAAEWGSNYFQLYQANDHNQFLQVDGNGFSAYAGGVPGFHVFPGVNYTTQTLRPNVDSSIHLGASGGRFRDLFVGAAVGSQVTCDADSRGGFMLVFATAGNEDPLQICKRLADNSYTWKTVPTP